MGTPGIAGSAQKSQLATVVTSPPEIEGYSRDFSDLFGPNETAPHSFRRLNVIDPSPTSSVAYSFNVASYSTPSADQPLVKWSYRNQEQVLSFLEECPNIKSLFSLLERPLSDKFGIGTEVALEVIVYPEEGGQDGLVAWIRYKGSIEGGIEKFDLFVESYDDKIWKAGGNRFHFNIEVI